MNSTFTRTITLSVSAVSLDTPIDSATISDLRMDGITRLQASLVPLLSQGIRSGTLTYQDRAPAVNLNWSIDVIDHPSAKP